MRSAPWPFGRSLGGSSDSQRTFPTFGELQVAHQIVSQVHQADLELGPSQTNGADEFPTHAVLLEAEDMLDAGANLGARAIVCLLFVRERLVVLTFLANVTFIASVLQNLLRLLTAVRTISPHP